MHFSLIKLKAHINFFFHFDWQFIRFEQYNGANFLKNGVELSALSLK